MRINTRDSGFDLISVDGWISIDGGPDVAVAPVSLDPTRHAVEALRADWLLAQDDVSRLEIDAGDDVFMVGRFVDYDGLQSNRPSLRFGHVSMKEANIRQKATGYAGASFIVDMHSRSGYSGSPVFIYRTHGSIFARDKSVVVGGHLMKLLGIHWGQFPELWEIATLPSQSERAEAAEAHLLVEGQQVHGLSGMTCVVPAWDILALLSDVRLADHRARVEAELHQ